MFVSIFRGVSKAFKTRFKNVSRVIQGSHKDLSSKFQEDPKMVSWAFQECGCFKVFQRSFKIFYECFNFVLYLNLIIRAVRVKRSTEAQLSCTDILAESPASALLPGDSIRTEETWLLLLSEI